MSNELMSGELMSGESNSFQHVDRLVTRLHSLRDADARAAALELVKTILEFHASGLDRMMELTSAAGETGWAIMDEFGRDALVSNMLLLHGLHPLDTTTRVRDALEKVRPYLQSHGGNVELIEVSGDTVRLRLIGSCNGCPSSSLTLKAAIETSIKELAPEITSIRSEGVDNGTSPSVSVNAA
jgi:Fe-S cluster biogenesis protein NfuA